MPLIGALSPTNPRIAVLAEAFKPQSKVQLYRHFLRRMGTSGTEKARGGGLFKVDVPQVVEESSAFNHPKK